VTSSYTSPDYIEKPATGDQAGSWATTANLNYDLLTESNNGVVTQAVTSANVDLTFSAPPLASATGRNRVIKLTGTSTGQRTISVNAQDKMFFVHNATSGGFDHLVRVTGGGGAAVTIPNGKSMAIYCDGTDCVEAQTYISGYALLSGATFSGSVAMPSNGLNVGSGQLQVTGGNVSISGGLTVGGTVNVTGSEVVSTNLTVNGVSTLNGAINLGDAAGDVLTVAATPTFSAPVTFSSTTAHTGAATFDGNVTLGNAAGDAITVSGTATFGQFTTFSTGVNVVASVSSAPALRCQTDTNTGVYFSGSDALGLTTNGISRVFVGSDGKVGIGTTSPSMNLSVVGDLSIRPSASVTPTTTGDLVFEATSDTQVKVKLKGSDGIVRSVTLTLA
jgi:hypothetical protein